MIHVDTFINDELVAAYTTTDGEIPPGTVEGRQGNAVLIRGAWDLVHVVSRPRYEGDILNVIPDAASAPEVDLSGYFS